MRDFILIGLLLFDSISPVIWLLSDISTFLILILKFFSLWPIILIFSCISLDFSIKLSAFTSFGIWKYPLNAPKLSLLNIFDLIKLSFSYSSSSIFLFGNIFGALSGKLFIVIPWNLTFSPMEVWFYPLLKKRLFLGLT